MEEFRISREEFIKIAKEKANKVYTPKATITSKEVYKKIAEHYKDKEIRDEKGRFIKGKPQETNKNGTAGRPSVMTNKVVSDLKKAFAMGFTDVEACLFAKISKASLYRYIKENPDFWDQKETLKHKPKLKAKMNLLTAINNQDIETSKWYLERKSSNEFSKRTNIAGGLVNIDKEEDEAVSKILQQLGIDDEDS